MQEQWEACSAAIAARMSEQAYRTWIQPLTFLAFDADTCLLHLGAPTQFKADVVRNQYLNLINEVVHDAIDPAVHADIEVLKPAAIPSAADAATATAAEHTSSVASPVSPEQPLPASAAAQPSVSQPLTAPPRAGSANPPSNEDDELSAETVEDEDLDEHGAPAGGAFAGLGNRAPDEKSRLNPGLTFGTFVTGKANDLARAASLQVADRPGSAYNPLFIQGGVGLGKTHLMQAIGNAIQEREPQAAIRYVTANQFFQDFVSAVRRESVHSFQSYYRSLDLLLIDDIQFLSEKKRSQEEFFFIFEALVNNRRQIVISSDTYPKELTQKLDERLISRLNSGLIVAIDAPELEMRVAILQRKAEQVRVRLSEDVAYFIGKNIRQNVRELEGALQRVIHYAAFRSQPITLDLVKEALKDILSFNRGQISIEFIQKTVADYYKIKLSDMYSKRKPAKIALPRQIAMYLAKELTQKSLPEIGEAFGGKDHTTVLYAVRKITELRAHKPELNTQIHVLDQTLREYL
ncbi:MAG: chromosomal replication initiator protein DnaA [Lautropia sp.]|nr:chromosomal replication initiator protein DnaA [Lautropia sp.]